MTHRIISAEHPDRVLRHARDAGCICRTEQTNYRGPVAFIGEGRVWGVAKLREVKLATKGKAKDGVEAPQGYYWCFDDVREVEAIPCANYLPPAMFQNGAEWEPQFLQASAQAALNRLLSPGSGLESPETASDAQVVAEEPQALELAESAPLLRQLELF